MPSKNSKHMQSLSSLSVMGEHTRLWSEDLPETQTTTSIPDSFTVTETRLQTLRGNRPPKFRHSD